MNNQNIFSGIVAAVTATVVTVVIMVAVHLAGGTGGSFGTTAAPSSGVSHFNGIESDTGFFDAAGAVSNFLGSLEFSNNTTTAGPAFMGTASTCNAASSTLFAVASPFGATSTSTATVISFAGTGNATSSNLQIGTSTTATGLTASTVSNTLVNTTVGTTSPKFYIQSGLNLPDVAGGIAAGSGTFKTIIVPPGDYVAAYATSTYGGSGAVGYVAGFSSCTYKILWQQ